MTNSLLSPSPYLYHILLLLPDKALVNQAAAWGWSSERIVVIDEDQDNSGASADTRSGFQRLVTDVGLNHVGLILGVEMSQLARCSKDWHPAGCGFCRRARVPDSL